MTQSANTAPENIKKGRLWSVCRVALLATTVFGLGAATFMVGPALNFVSGYPAALAQNSIEQEHKIPAPVGFADVVAKVKPAVISVRVKVEDATSTTGLGNDQVPPGLRNFFHHFGVPGFSGMPNSQRHLVLGQGSGFFISSDGYAVTNNHVVEHAESVKVTTDNGKTYRAKVIGTDPRTDLALIKVNGGPFPYVKFAKKPPRIGDWVLAVGNPFGLGGTVTAGIVSARGRDIGASPYDDFIQIDAPVNRGNSGGPAFDVNGNVIGVNTAIFSPSGGSVGIAFAIPADTVRSVVTQLREHGMVTRGWIGVEIQPVTKGIADSLGLKKAEGALVAQPQPNSPASKAGIRAGDVITAVDGKEVKDARDLARKIGALAPGTSVKLSVVHNSSVKTVTLTLAKMPKSVEEASASSPNSNQSQKNSNGSVNLANLGLTLAPASRVAGAGKQGVVVTNVDSSGPAASHGFSTGDVILEVAGKTVSTPAEVREAIASVRSQGKRTVLMRVKKSDGTRFVALPVGAG